MRKSTIIPALLFSALSMTQVANAAPVSSSLTPLENQVRHELIMLPYYGVFDNLTFHVDGHTVTLSGEVNRPLLKSEAQKVVKRLPGVENVINEIKILPPSLLDDQIRYQALRTIYGFGPLQRYGAGTNPSIRIIVDNGHVTLEGKVANQTDANLAFLRASGLSNVFSVTNNLQVER